MSTSKKKLDPSNLVLGAPAVDPEARRKFVEGEGGAEPAAPNGKAAGQGAKATKGKASKAAAPIPAPAPATGGKVLKADRKKRQLLVYMSTPELRREVDIRVAHVGGSLSAFVERLVVAELAKPVKARS